ncbi:MAG TPA: FAD-dependent oxidoreductase [Streptosporangiaceae bacterium]|nr:FAD-dependent oxidoreductase [Streptosporangiaceae bacterium]
MAERIIVVGGGIVGSSAAYRLARRGVSVTLIDRADQGHATAAGAGIVSAGDSFDEPSAWYPLAFRSVAYYPELLASLAEDGIADTGYAVPGGMIIATDDAERQRLAAARRLIGERREAGVANIGELTMLDGADVQKLFPPLAPGTSALHLSGVARVNGRTMRDALQQATRRRGGQVRRAAAELAVDGSRAVGVKAAVGLITADAVILATGAWDDAWAAHLGATVPVAPQRGQILHLDLPGADTDVSRWPVITGPGDPYLLAFPPHRIVSGATREDGTGFDYRVTAGGQAELLAATLTRAPGLAAATVAETRVGFRPFALDRLPVLGRAPGLENVWLATGLGATGLTLGPCVGAMAADMSCGEAPPLDMAPYAPARFQPR